MPDLPAYLKMIAQLLFTPNGALAAAATAAAALLIRAALKKREIPGLTIETVPQDTWFIHRDDNRQLAIVVTLKIDNRSGRETRLETMRFSGYKPQNDAPPILLEGAQTSAPLPYPDAEQYRPDQACAVPPFSTQTLWALYASKSVHLRNKLSAPIILKSSDGKRTALRVDIRRHPWQIALYNAA